MSDRPPRTPLASPRRYFERADDPLPAGFAVFAVHVVGTLLLMYVTVRGIFQRIPNPPAGLEGQLTTVLFITALATGLFACIGLLVVAAFMHYGSGRSPEQRGAYRDAVAVAGWAYAPNALSLPVSYLLVRRQFRRIGFGASSPEALQAELEAVQTPNGLQVALTLAVVGWSVYILAYGTAATHDADLGDTLILAAVVGVVAFLASFL